MESREQNTTKPAIADHMPFVYDDGGRKETGRKGSAGDCVCRSIAIASGRPYDEVYTALADGSGSERRSRGKSARNGVRTTRKWFKEYMNSLGFEWVACMGIGTGCKVHLVAGELPTGRMVVSVSGHYTVVIDGVVYDTHDPQRRTYWYGSDGKVERASERCVYGYWIARTEEATR
jgi:hypothetical protein